MRALELPARAFRQQDSREFTFQNRLNIFAIGLSSDLVMRPGEKLLKLLSLEAVRLGPARCQCSRCEFNEGWKPDATSNHATFSREHGRKVMNNMQHRQAHPLAKPVRNIPTHYQGAHIQ